MKSYRFYSGDMNSPAENMNIKADAWTYNNEDRTVTFSRSQVPRGFGSAFATFSVLPGWFVVEKDE